MWVVYALLASMVWGLDYVLAGRLLQERIAPLTLLALQMLVGGAVFLVTACFSTLKADLGVISSNRSTLIATIGAIGAFAIGNFLIALSIQAKNATLAGLIEISYPIFIALFSLLLFKEAHASPSVLLGCLFIFIGVAMVYAYN
jgi:drug/metabolite transporter (DMT)-like permease